MQQRRLRLGDILDDYCPRERRVTNHAVVAMIGDTVRQTRCTTCDAEHEYKGAKVPPQRRKKETAAPGAGEVVETQVARGVIRRGDVDSEGEPILASERADGEAVAEEPASAADPLPADEQAPAIRASTGHAPSVAEQDEQEEGPLHRPLIRATLPRPEGQVPARPNADFTMRHAPNHPAGFQANRSGRPHAARPGRPAVGGGSGRGAHRFGVAAHPGGPNGNRQPGRGNQRPGQGQHARPAGGQSSRPGKKHR